MLSPSLLRLLRSPEGQAALHLASELAPTEATFLSASQQLARRFPEALARAAVEQAILRERASGKFRFASRMFFLREALEQATTEAVAIHRAQRFHGAAWVFDLGCGIGGDALALATVGRVMAVDRDGLRLAVLMANGAALGMESRLLPLEADVLNPAWSPPPTALAFADPSRRHNGRRARSAYSADPPLGPLLTVLSSFPGAAVKHSPAVDLEEIRALGEVEFVSLDGDLKEATLWMGSLRGASRRATILPEGVSLEGDEEPQVDVGQLDTYLYEPDPAVMRARLVRTLAARIGAHLIDPSLAFLSSSAPMDTPFARRYVIEEVLPFGLKRLRESLRARRIGRVTLKKRGSPVDTESFQRRLRLDGDGEATVILTRAEGRRVALLVRRCSGLEGATPRPSSNGR